MVGVMEKLTDFLKEQLRILELELIYGSEYNSDWRMGKIDAYKEMIEFFSKRDERLDKLLDYINNKLNSLRKQLKVPFINKEKIKIRINELEKILKVLENA